VSVEYSCNIYHLPVCPLPNYQNCLVLLSGTLLLDVHENQSVAIKPVHMVGQHLTLFHRHFEAISLVFIAMIVKNLMCFQKTDGWIS